MRLLIIGGGGREHALAWKLNQNPRVDKIFAIPGNGGIQDIAESVNVTSTPVALAEFAEKESIDLTVVGPEIPLVAGVVDEFERRGMSIFGPSKKAAQIEGSKAFAKEIMEKSGVATGKARVFDDYDQAHAYLAEQHPPYVIKADGLAGGKGVIIAEGQDAAVDALKSCLLSKKFGEAGGTVLIEEFLEGEEVSLLAFCDGKNILPMVPAQDYKRIFDGDRGPNTGGMGSYSPVPAVSGRLYDEIVDTVLSPTIKGLQDLGIDFRGILYAGIILTENGPKVLEFNARFGDPETQAILPRLESDLLSVMIAVARGDLSGIELSWSEKYCVSVVLASEGYPENQIIGREITGLKNAEAIEGVNIFHAGTKRSDGKIITSGGRVLNVSALGDSYTQARERAYAACDLINFEGKQFRTDIGARATEVRV